MNELENNLKSYLDWCFLGIGAFVNVTIPTSGSFGGVFHVLKPSQDPSFTAGRVWEAQRKDWVWERNIEWTGTQPIAISGVWVNGTLYGTGHATYGHYYDYPNGRVVFSGAIPTTSTVHLNYSYRWVQTYISDRADWFYEGQYASLRPDNAEWATAYPTGGSSAILPNHRVQFPAIVIEAVARTNLQPYELGSKSHWIYQDVVFNIISDNKWGRNKLSDILMMEKGHNIWLYDTDEVIISGIYPLDYRGMLINTTGMYPYLVNNCPFYRCRFNDTVRAEVESLNPKLHEGKVRAEMELILGSL